MENMEIRGLKVLVTGGTGFVGSHLVESLAQEGARVVVLNRSMDSTSYFATQRLERNVVLANGDLKDFSRILDIITKYEIDFIFHLGAQAIVTTAYTNPLETISTNVLGTTNIVECARLCKTIKGIIVASSDKAYGKSSKAYIEQSPLRGDHPYEVSKSSADLISHAYYKTYNLPIIITRFGNIYGEGDLNYNRIIPGIFQSLLTKKPLLLRSDGRFVREYNYVKDVAQAYMLLLQQSMNIAGQAYNISSGEKMSVIDLINNVEVILKRKITYTIENNAVNEIPIQTLNAEKIRKLGWKPSNTFKTGIQKSYLWYSKHSKQLFR